MIEVHRPEIEAIRQDPDVRRVEPMCPEPECYAIRYEDGSAMLVNAKGEHIKSPLDKLEFITDIQYIGTIKGMPHFAYEGRDYANRHMSETGMFDANGHQKLFRDPRSAGIEGVNYIKWEFERLEKQANDPRNPRRDDPVLIDLDEKQSHGLRMR